MLSYLQNRALSLKYQAQNPHPLTHRELVSLCASCVAWAAFVNKEVYKVLLNHPNIRALKWIDRLDTAFKRLPQERSTPEQITTCLSAHLDFGMHALDVVDFLESKEGPED